MAPAQPIAIAKPQAETPQAQAPGGDADEQHEARVAARIAELGILSRKTDRASLETLLSEVKNPDPEIRQGALDAITQSGNRAAIPGLRDAVAQTTDPREQQAILDVIEFMELPTLTEVLRQQRGTNNRPVQRKQ